MEHLASALVTIAVLGFIALLFKWIGMGKYAELFGDPNLSHDVNQLFRKLNPGEQTLLWLAYVEGFQHREIAEALNLKEKSVRVLLFRARKQLAGMAIQEGMGPKEKA